MSMWSCVGGVVYTVVFTLPHLFYRCLNAELLNYAVTQTL